MGRGGVNGMPGFPPLPMPGVRRVVAVGSTDLRSQHLTFSSSSVKFVVSMHHPKQLTTCSICGGGCLPCVTLP